MENFLNWVTTNYLELLSYIGLGAGGAVGAQKLRDKHQDAKIKKHTDLLHEIDKRLNDMDKQLVAVQNEINMNSQMDTLNKERTNQILEELREGQRQTHALLMEMVTGKIRLK
jgi:transposase